MNKLKIAIAVLTAALLVASTGLSSAEPGEPNHPDNLKEVVAYGEARVPRWLADTITRAAQVTGVDATYLLALADKEFKLLLSGEGSDLLRRRSLPVSGGNLAGGAE